MRDPTANLSWRGKYRLRLAAGLLRSRGQRFDIPRDQFYEAMTRQLAELSPQDRLSLKALVDWVEDFDPADALSLRKSD